MLENFWILCTPIIKPLIRRAREKQAEKPQNLLCFPIRIPTLSPTLALIYNYGCGELDLLYNLYYGLGRAVLQLAAGKIREGILMDNFPASEQAQ